MLTILLATTILSNMPTGTCGSIVQDMHWQSDARRADTGESAGFAFFAAHDPGAGCDPTILNPIPGLFFGTFTEDEYRIDVLAQYLEQYTCGRIQFDAQGYLSNGALDPSALTTFVFNTGVDCRRGEDSPPTNTPPPSRPSKPDAPPPPVHQVPDSGSVAYIAFGLLILTQKWHRRN